MSMNGWTDFKKRKVVYTCNGILFSLTKEGNPEICDDMDIMLSKTGQSQKDKHYMIPLMWSI